MSNIIRTTNYMSNSEQKEYFLQNASEQTRAYYIANRQLGNANYFLNSEQIPDPVPDTNYLTIVNVNNQNIDIYYKSSIPIAGFQFVLVQTNNQVTIIDASGGGAADATFSINFNNNIMLGFSFAGNIIPAGEGILVKLTLNNYDNTLPLCIANLVLSDPSGSAIPYDNSSNKLCYAPVASNLAIKFVNGLVPNWMQPKYYENIAMTPPGPMIGDILTTNGYPVGIFGGSAYSNISFLAWCAPTAAACQLGHLNHYNTQLLINPSDNVDAGTEPIANKTIHWNIAGPGWGDYLLDGPNVPRPMIGDTAYAGPTTDFGYYMDTNNVGINGSSAGSAIGTKIINIYNGLVKFYQMAAPAVTNIGMCYNKSPYILSGIAPDYWISNNLNAVMAAQTQTTMLNTIKHEIDNNRTVLVCLKYWNIASQSAVTQITNNNETDIEYYNILNAVTQNPLTQETYNWNEDYDTALGHTVLIVGYINKGSTLDMSPNNDTDWVIVRDNQENTHRNVAIPYNQSNVTTLWDLLLATIFVKL